MRTHFLGAGRSARRLIATSMLTLTACGVASVSAIVPEAEQEFDPTLVGTWRSTESTEFAVISGDSGAGYRLVYVSEDGSTGRFAARLGRLGEFRVLDLKPTDLDLARDGSFYESLVLRLHSFVVIDRVTPTELVFRMVESDSLEALLRREPGAVAHVAPEEEGGSVITAPTAEARRFFERLLRQRGMLTESGVFVRQR